MRFNETDFKKKMMHELVYPVVNCHPAWPFHPLPSKKIKKIMIPKRILHQPYLPNRSAPCEKNNRLFKSVFYSIDVLLKQKPQHPPEREEPEKKPSPNVPDQPKKPLPPEWPKKPNQPNKPSPPERPDKPYLPDQPDKPTPPEHPNKPDQPNQPVASHNLNVQFSVRN